MSYFGESEYSLNINVRSNSNDMGGSGNKKMLSFGLPLGSGMVLIALLNTIFTAHSILNFVEIVAITGAFSVKSHLLPVLIVGFLFILTGYLWIAVIFTGRSYHVSIWIAGSLLLLLLKVVISSWTLLVSLSLKDALYWRKLWVLGVDIAMEVYILSLAVLAANVLWRRDDRDRGSLGPPPQYQRYIGCGSDIDLDVDLDVELENHQGQELSLPLSPVGLKLKDFAEFYMLPKNIELGASVAVLLDIIYSVYILVTEKFPEVLLSNRNKYAEEDYDEFYEGGPFTLSKFGEKRLLLIFMEDTVLRLGRVVAGLVAVSFLMKRRTASRKLSHALVASLILVSISLVIYFTLFGLFEQLSPSDRFYQVKFTLDLLLRLGVIGFLIKAVEKRRLVQTFVRDSIAGNVMYSNNEFG